LTPLVIAHRGASGYRPEHTLAAYQLAIDLGADYIEPDLVSTKDGVLVARHENEIGGTTDVASHPEFASRRTSKTVDGLKVTGWFSEDFTLAELKTLRARERLPTLRPGNTAYDGLYEVPTLEELLDLVRRSSAAVGRAVGIYPETKHPSYFRSIGLPLEEPLVEALRRSGLPDDSVPVYIQSFEVANLRMLDAITQLPLIQLLDSTGAPHDFGLAGDQRTYADLATPAGLREIATYADGIGPEKGLVISRDAAGLLQTPTTLVAEAHALDLVVHAWTFRAENEFLPAEHRLGAGPGMHGDWAAEYAAFYATGLDGVFTDQPDLAVAARQPAMP
jgi:glycerophosphoryl diester phosphodiesterase